MAGSGRNLLREALQERGWSYTRLAVELRRHAAGSQLPKTESLVTLISRWVNNHQQPDDFYRDLLAKALGQSHADLFGGRGVYLEPSAMVGPAELPHDVAGFVGRSDEIHEFRRRLLGTGHGTGGARAPTRRPASRPAAAATRPCHPARPARCGSTTTTTAAGRLPIWGRLRRRPGTRVRPLRPLHRHQAVHGPGRTGHDQPALRLGQTRVLNRRQRLLPPRPGRHRPARRALPQRRHGSLHGTPPGATRSTSTSRWSSTRPWRPTTSPTSTSSGSDWPTSSSATTPPSGPWGGGSPPPTSTTCSTGPTSISSRPPHRPPEGRMINPR